MILLVLVKIFVLVFKVYNVLLILALIYHVRIHVKPS